ncbi:glutathione S-transferase family protein [Hydrogenophaga sp.]|uniref:glutathione S-transferase family protein n=2 Tax=Hydrogenophaga sp. TaxID=1904254 RepID=UPI0025BED54A|nr:glutathione S-transferase [Hydrogenophaga sp.]
MKPTLQLYRNAVSGHCHRVELFLSLLGLPFDSIDVDLAAKAHKLPAFLAMNPLGQVPVLRDGDVTLADSNAILVYLEAQYAPGQWLPRDPVGAARVQRWLSLAAGPLAFGPAAARVVQLFKLPTDPKDAIARAEGLLQFMEAELGRTPFLVGERATLADVAHYAYVARAPEGLVSLQPYPAVRAWLARIEALPGFVPMLKLPIGLAA